MITSSDKQIKEQASYYTEIKERLELQLKRKLIQMTPIVTIRYTVGELLKQFYFVFRVNELYTISNGSPVQTSRDKVIKENMPRLFNIFVSDIMKDEPNAFPI